MKRTIKNFLLAAMLAISGGCRIYSYARAYPDGSFVSARVMVCMSNSKLDAFRALVLTNRTEFTLTGAKVDTDSASVGAIAEGVTKAIIKSVVPLP